MKLLNLILKDDHTNNGGISHDEYTLEEFLYDTDLHIELNDIENIKENELNIINKSLNDNGILPVTKVNYNLDLRVNNNNIVYIKNIL